MNAEFHCRPTEEIEIPFVESISWAHRLGWKQEYLGGKLHLSPDPSALAECKRDTAFTAPSNWILTPISDLDREALRYLLCWAFHDSVHYVGYTPERFVEEIDREVNGIFSTSSAIRELCFAIRDHDMLVGAIVVQVTLDGPKIGPLAVAPSHHRKGIAATLLGSVCERMRQEDGSEIRSSFHLGNHNSAKWHARCGFAEIPNWHTAGHRQRHYLQQSKHYAAQKEPQLAITMQSVADQYGRLADQLRDQVLSESLKDASTEDGKREADSQ